MPKAVHHVVTRPGRTLDEPDVEIPVAEDLATVPGIPQRENDVAFYSRVYPLETQVSVRTAVTIAPIAGKSATTRPRIPFERRGPSVVVWARSLSRSY